MKQIIISIPNLTKAKEEYVDIVYLLAILINGINVTNPDIFTQITTGQVNDYCIETLPLSGDLEDTYFDPYIHEIVNYDILLNMIHKAVEMIKYELHSLYIKLELEKILKHYQLDEVIDLYGDDVMLNLIPRTKWLGG